MINHHPPLELLFDYATGSLAEPVALVVASHAALCGECRTQVRAAESLGGALLDAIEPVEVDGGALEAVMARLDEPEIVAARAGAESDGETVALVPEPLLPYLGRGLAHLAWRGVGRMFEEAPLRTALKGFKTSLMRLKPGAEMPVHTHRGTEYTLVLAGGFKDNGEQFVRGDFAFKDSSDEHRPVVDTDEPCLCLVVLDAPVKLTSAMGRLVNPFLRI